MINKKEIKNIVEVENIMTIKINTVSKRSDTASLESWDFGIEDEGTKTGQTRRHICSTELTEIIHGQKLLCARIRQYCATFTHMRLHMYFIG